MKNHKIVKVEWEDSCNYSGWRKSPASKSYEPSSCMSCGILVKTKKGSIGVTHSVGDKDNDEVADTMVISRKAIKKIEVIGKFRR